MILEAILVLAVLVTGLVVCLDKILYPRHSRIFRGKPKLVVLSQSLFPVLVVVLLLRSFTFEGFRIPSSSMKPTLMEGDLIIVDKFSLGLRIPILGLRLTGGQPQRGDVVVFRGEVGGETAGIIKRIVGLPGDHIQYSNRTLYINGTPATQYDISVAQDVLSNGASEKVIRATEDLGSKKHNIIMSLHNNDDGFKYEDLIVPKDSYFVLGDNRSNSHDSRYWGVLSDQKLIGKARAIIFSLDWPHKDVRWKRIGKIS
ncbi:MAG TPA: signal peptidase I [Gammaproteobacteria bacterium]|nr:signal peptidase I [Gammaproteobacteria bacterium]